MQSYKLKDKELLVGASTQCIEKLSGWLHKKLSQDVVVKLLVVMGGGV